MKNKTLWIILGIVAVILIWGITSYNGLVSKEENIAKTWGDVQADYQRRADLIPNLVNTVKGYAAHESETLAQLTEARTKATSINIDLSTATPEQMEAYLKAQEEVGSVVNSALSRLIAISESYPDLKADKNFRELQVQLEGTENRIATSRKNYNEAVRDYNAKLRRFPSNIIAGMFGFEKHVMFEAQQGAEQAVTVEF